MLSTVTFNIPQIQVPAQGPAAAGTPAENKIDLFSAATGLSLSNTKNFSIAAISLLVGINLAPTSWQTLFLIDNIAVASVPMFWAFDQQSFIDPAKTTVYTAHMWRGVLYLPEPIDNTGQSLSLDLCFPAIGAGTWTIVTDLFYSIGALLGHFDR